MIEVVKPQIGDLADIARLHREVFPGFFLTKLGDKFLRELYMGFLVQSSGILFVAKDGIELVGFVAGAAEPDVFFSGLRRRRWASFLIKAIPAAMKSPLLVCRKLYAAMFYKGDAPLASKSWALLSSLGVSTHYRGTAVAELLLASFEAEAMKAHASHVYLMTDSSGNERVQAFYSKNNYMVESCFLQHGCRPMYRYLKHLL